MGRAWFLGAEQPRSILPTSSAEPSVEASPGCRCDTLF